MQQCNANELYGDDDDEYIHDDAMIPKRTATDDIYKHCYIYCMQQTNQSSQLYNHALANICDISFLSSSLSISQLKEDSSSHIYSSVALR